MYDKAAKLFEIPDLALPFMETFLDTEAVSYTHLTLPTTERV